MTRAASQVTNEEVCQFLILIDGLLGSRYGWLHKILPSGLELRSCTRIVIKVDASNGILYHILYYPVGRKDLSGCRNLIRVVLSFLGKHFVLALRNIELVEPANQLWRMEVRICDEFRMIQHVDKASLCQNIVGQQQFRIVGHGAKALEEDGIVVAESRHENGKLLCGLRVIIQQFHQQLTLAFLHLRDATHTGFIHDSWCAGCIHILQNWLDELIFHQDTNSDKTVEPGVGSLFIDFLDALLLYSLVKSLPLVVKTFCLKLAIPE